jgi:hypothetical protein
MAPLNHSPSIVEITPTRTAAPRGRVDVFYETKACLSFVEDVA